MTDEKKEKLKVLLASCLTAALAITTIYIDC